LTIGLLAAPQPYSKCYLILAERDKRRSVFCSKVYCLVRLRSLGGGGSVEDWVERELNGYKELPLPDYREVYGKPVYKHPMRQSAALNRDFSACSASSTVPREIGSLSRMNDESRRLHL